jgi:protoporphyrinogen oxidase
VGEDIFVKTGHMLHLRDPEIIAFVDRMMPAGFDEIERRAAIRSHGVLLPYPFQANTHGLPPEVVFECVAGLYRALHGPGSGGALPADVNFHDWALATFGEGIAKHFMLPYNAKMWLRDLREVTADWVSWAVPRPTMEEVLRGALGLTNTGLGYNPKFRYPKDGGIGMLPAALAEGADTLNEIRYRTDVVEVDCDGRTVRTAQGETIAYDSLVCTAPLPALVSRMRGLPAELKTLAHGLDWVDVYCLNLGIDRPHALAHHWVYFPEPEFPFYRVGAPSEFSSAVAPPGTTSLYVEVAVRRGEEVDEAALETRLLEGLARAGIVRETDRILAKDLIRISPAYVLFDRARMAAMAPLLDALRARRIHAIGRFGAWTYSYMEAAMKDGARIARELLGESEGPPPVLPPLQAREASAGKD